MGIKYLTNTICIIILLFVFNCCKSDGTNSIGFSLDKRIEAFGLSVQNFKIDSLKDYFFVGSNGSIVKISEKAIIKFGISGISIFEALDRKTMIKAGLTTESNGRLLESAGMIHIEVISKYGKNLDLKNTGCEIYFPKLDSLKKMKLFLGEGDETVNWILNDKPDPILKFATDTTADYGYRYVPLFSDFYCFPLLKDGWVNADLFYDSEDYLTLTFVLPSQDIKTTYCMVFQGFNGIISGKINQLGELVFDQVPKGEKGEIIGIGIDGAKIYLSIDIVENNKDTFNQLSRLEIVSEVELDKKLSHLGNI